MKHIPILLLFTVLLFIFPGCENDDIYFRYGDQDIDQFIMEAYYEDARQLYFEALREDPSHKNYNNPNLDENEILEILGIIQAVYNLKIPETENIFIVHHIHVHQCYSFNWMTLQLKPEYAEIENFSNSIIPTGYPQLDEILLTYNIDSVKVPNYYPDLPYLDVYSKNDYNLIAIANKLSSVESIVGGVNSWGCGGDGPDISLKRNNRTATITFSLGWGDLHGRMYSSSVLGV